MQAKKLRLLTLITVLSLVLSFSVVLPVSASAENTVIDLRHAGGAEQPCTDYCSYQHTGLPHYKRRLV